MPSELDATRTGVLLLVGVSMTLLGAIVTSGSRARRSFGVALALSAALVPWLLPPEHVFLRAAAALVAFVGAGRTFDLHRGEWSLTRRLVHVVSVVDTRRLRAIPRRFDRRVFMEGVAWLTLELVGLALLRARIPLGGFAFCTARWGFGLLATYSGVSAGYRFAEFGYASLGFATGRLHVAPLHARSVQEFWGERWARPVAVWLGSNCFWPYARKRRPLTGALVAFAVSAGFHAYAIWVALGFSRGLLPTVSMFAFFVAQAAIIASERRLDVKKWRPLAGHVWTVTVMLATAPLFVEPAVRVLGASPP